jgi:hypothetical protein
MEYQAGAKLWNPNSMCGEHSAEARAQWLVTNESLSYERARLQVQCEFPEVFQDPSTPWHGWIDCAGIPAEERAQWLVSNAGLDYEGAKARVRKEFPSEFASAAAGCNTTWQGWINCAGIPAEERAQWLVSNAGLDYEAAKARVRKEFPSEFASAPSGYSQAPVCPVDTSEELLSYIDTWIAGRPQMHGLLRTYDTINRHDVYDNALAVCYLTMRRHFTQAKPILDAFARHLYGNSSPDILGCAISAELPSGSTRLNLLLDSYGDSDRATDMGNNLFVGIAFARYAAASGESSYASIAHDILAAIMASRGCNDELGGIMRRLPSSQMNDMRSCEHNIDLKSLARMLREDAPQKSAEKFVSSLFTPYTCNGTARAKYRIGTQPAEKGSSFPSSSISDWPEGGFVTDTTCWNVLADADSENPASLGQALKSALSEVDATDVYEGEKYYGVKFSSLGQGIQWENTCSATAAMEHFLRQYPEVVESMVMGDMLKERITLYRDSIKRMLSKYHCMYASVHPTGDTGLGWKYLVTPHLGATAWAGMQLLHEAHGHAANPYGVPPGALPRKSEVMPR